MTAEMPDARYPLMCFTLNGMEYNQMNAYAGEMDLSAVCEHITPIDSSRTLEFRVDTYSADLEKISFQLRSILDGRLIEESQIYDYSHRDGYITGKFTVKDLIKEDVPYSLCMMIETKRGELLRYYTRLIKNDDFTPEEKLAFAYELSDLSFDRGRAATELSLYLESNASGDNSSFHHVDIHSSLSQVCWGELKISRLTAPRATIKEIDADTAQIRMDYIAKIEDEDDVHNCFVEEYYRMRPGEDRMFLLEFERSASQIFDMEASTLASNKIVLGISSEEVEKRESSDGNILAFANNGRLFSYNARENRMAMIFGFFKDDLTDRRSAARNSDIKVFQVDETGNVRFLVYGYMSCGTHEGQSGITLYEYDSLLNTVEEKIFIPYDGSKERLFMEADRLLYLSEKSIYMVRGGTIYEIKPDNRSINTLVEDLPMKGMVASKNHEVVAWCDKSPLYDTRTLIVKNLNTGVSNAIIADDGERLLPISFFDNDLIYGVAKEKDISTDKSGRMVFPMYRLCIRSISGTLLKQYEVPDVYVTEITEGKDMISLKRMKKNAIGILEEYTEDQILDNDTSVKLRNKIETVVTERYETIVQIAVRSEIKKDTLKRQIPRILLYEGDRQLAVKSRDEDSDNVYVTRGGKICGFYENVYEAEAEAWENGGTVRTMEGFNIFARVTLPPKNQIMAIQEPAGENDGTPEGITATCVNTILRYENEPLVTPYGISSAGNPARALEKLLPDHRVLELNGAQPEEILYYLAKDIPVLALMNDGSSMLLTGYNELNFVVLNPAGRVPDGAVLYKIGRKDGTKLFEENGNRFITYISLED